jgi:hypothetical protein
MRHRSETWLFWASVLAIFTHGYIGFAALAKAQFKAQNSLAPTTHLDAAPAF